MRFKERRASPRFQIEFPVLFRWIDNGVHYRTGFSSNASHTGVSVIAFVFPPPHADIDLLVFLSVADPAADHSRLHFAGRVIRLQDLPLEKGGGFAAFGSFRGPG